MKDEMPAFAKITSTRSEPEVRDRIDEPLEVQFPPNGTSLDLLQAIYRSPKVELTMRIRCAMACLQYEHPKLAVVAQVTDQGLAELLDRRLKKLAAMEQNGSKAIAIDGPKPEVEIRPPMPRVSDRRYRRM